MGLLDFLTGEEDNQNKNNQAGQTPGQATGGNQAQGNPNALGGGNPNTQQGYPAQSPQPFQANSATPHLPASNANANTNSMGNSSPLAASTAGNGNFGGGNQTFGGGAGSGSGTQSVNNNSSMSGNMGSDINYPLSNNPQQSTTSSDPGDVDPLGSIQPYGGQPANLSNNDTKGLQEDKTQVSSIQPTAESGQPGASSQRPEADSGQPTASSQQPTASNQQPTENISTPLGELNLPKLDINRLTGQSETNSTNSTPSQKPVQDNKTTRLQEDKTQVSSEQPTAESGQPTASSQQQKANNSRQQLASDDVQIGVQNNSNKQTTKTKPSTNSPQPSAIGNQPTQDDKTTKLQEGENLVTGSQLPVPSKQTADSEQPKADSGKPQIHPKNIFKKIALFGLDGNNVDTSLGNTVNRIARILFGSKIEVILDTSKGLGEHALQAANNSSNKIKVVDLKPMLSSEFSKGNSQVSESKNFTIVYSNYSERLKHLLKEPMMFIFFESGGIYNYATLLSAISISKMYQGQHKPVILFGNSWNQKVSEMQSLMGLNQKDLETVEIVSNPDEMINKMNELSSSMASNLTSDIQKVVDRRVEGDEKDLIVY